MAKNEQTSDVIASLSGKVLTGKYDVASHEEILRVLYALAGSNLTQAPDKPKKAGRAKAKKGDQRKIR